jgi:Gluconate 2-dehydrogenase subunit 3
VSVRDAKTGAELPQKKQPGYYPGYNTLSQRKFWDAATRAVIEKRVNALPPIRFFTADELPLITAVTERVLPQDDRLPEWRIPIVGPLDERLFSNRIHGFRFEDMPSDQEAYRLGLRAIDATAKALHGRGFVELRPLQQDEVLKSIADGKKIAGEAAWQGLSMERFWSLLVQDCASAYYAHPWAWDEIGYGGPAYPRAYTRLEGGLPEPWERDEVRYEWLAPADSLSDALSGPEEGGSDQSHPAQGGTH